VNFGLLPTWQPVAPAGIGSESAMTRVTSGSKMDGMSTQHQDTADESGKRRPIFMLSTEGKTKGQIKAEAREALARYLEAQKNP
jgi:hypothetical protein